MRQAPSSPDPVVRRPLRAAACRVAVLFVLCQNASAAPPTSAPAVDGVAYSVRIAPLLAERCGACHGAERQRGDLALHTPEAIAKGGDSGPALVAGDPGRSEILRRLRLPIDDLEHMPPEGKPQLSEEEIAAIAQWIAQGAVFDAPATAPADPAEAAREPVVPAVARIAPPDPAAIAALQARLVNVEAVAQASNLVRVNFAAVAAKTRDADVAALITPILPQLESLSLARCSVGDETAALIARAPHLKRLDLRGSRITDAAVATLSRLASLEELVLAQTRLTDGSVPHLLAMPGLQRLHVWKSGLSGEAIARLRTERPQLRVNAGDAADAAVREVEPDLKLTSDAPLPTSQPAAQTQPALVKASASSKPAGTLQPENTACPVSGSPVKSEYAVVYEGHVIGFCCPNCPKQFWADPAKFTAQLKLVQGNTAAP